MLRTYFGLPMVSLFMTITKCYSYFPSKLTYNRYRGMQTRFLSQSQIQSVHESSSSSPPKKFQPFPFQYHEELDVIIEDITNTGVGVARKDLDLGNDINTNWVIFCPLVLPGEHVRVKIYRNEKNYSEADLVKVIIPSEDRIEPKCEYFAKCGGCQYQHMNIESQRIWKRNQVRTQLSRYAGLQDAKINDVIGTDDYFFYRSKLTPHYDVPYSSHEVKIGFQKRGTRIIVDIDQCIIATPDINERYKTKREEIKASMAISKPKKGATLLFRQCEEGVETDFRKVITEKVGNLTFKFKAGEFFQNNAFMLPKMVDYVIDQASGRDCAGQGEGIKYMIDAYCGSGLFSLSASHLFEKVYGVEISRLAVDAAVQNAQLNGITNVEFLCGVSEGIFEKVKNLPREQTVILLDPPRKGCDDEFLSQLLAFRPKKIVYVSCDPSTQARDSKCIVDSNYEIIDIQPMDLFPQTRHIENVITFVSKEN